MLIFVWIAGCAVIGILVPRALVARPPQRWAVLKASVASWLVGGLFVAAGALAVSRMGGRDFKTEFEAAINGWKLLLLMAPAVALHFSRQRAAPAPGDD